MSYTSSFRAFNLWKYKHFKNITTRFMRFQYIMEPTKPTIVTAFPGVEHMKAIQELQV